MTEAASDAPQSRRRRLGLLGGTFDPPHRAHLILAAAAREALDLDRVIVVPAGDPWRKSDRDVTSAEVRLALTRVAFEDLPWAEVSSIEVRREGPSYTAETLTSAAGRRRARRRRLVVHPRAGRTRRPAALARAGAHRRPGAAGGRYAR